MKCPACGAAVEDGADLCLECGEPMGNSPAAKVARGESAGGAAASNVIRPPADTFQPKPAAPPTVKAKKIAPKRPSDDEAEPIRCPGCGVKSRAARCPSCGTRLRSDED